MVLPEVGDTTKDWKIRPASWDDLDTIVRFNAALAWESEGIRLDETVLRLGVEKVLRNRELGFYTVAHRGAEVIGQVSVTFEFSDWRNGLYWWIQSVYVPVQARRLGVFRGLYHHLEKQAIADPEVIGLRLYVEHENHHAQQTYANLGMVVESYKMFAKYPLPGRDNNIHL